MSFKKEENQNKKKKKIKKSKTIDKRPYLFIRGWTNNRGLRLGASVSYDLFGHFFYFHFNFSVYCIEIYLHHEDITLALLRLILKVIFKYSPSTDDYIVGNRRT